jgi:hypothetical protein
MTGNSPRQNCGVLRGAFETLLLFAVFVIAERIWPVRDFLEGK